MGYGLTQWGYEAVTTFIVLSGFCLGLQLERSRNVWAFMGRRSCRVLPPYFAALAVLCLLVMAKALRSGVWLQFPLRELLPNLFMVRELFPDPTDWLSGSVVFWSVGIEYRLYWLVPIFAACYQRWRFAGLGLSAIAFYCLGASILAMAGLPNGHLWLLFAFVFGIAAAQCLDCKLPVKLPAIALLTASVAIKSQLPTEPYVLGMLPVTDLMFGGMAALLLQAMTHSVLMGKSNRAIDFLSHPLLGWLAKWSYSLYLMHYGLLAYSGRWLGWQGVTGWNAIALQTIPVLLGCWLFSQAFERPFLKRHVAT